MAIGIIERFRATLESELLVGLSSLNHPFIPTLYNLFVHFSFLDRMLVHFVKSIQDILEIFKVTPIFRVCLYGRREKGWKEYGRGKKSGAQLLCILLERARQPTRGKLQNSPERFPLSFPHNLKKILGLTSFPSPLKCPTKQPFSLQFSLPPLFLLKQTNP